MSHHKKIYIVDSLCQEEANILKTIGHVRITNDGTILSIWINQGKQAMLFHPENRFVAEMYAPECECEYDDAGFTLYQCEVCHDAEQEARCSCVQDHINPDCQECY